MFRRGAEARAVRDSRLNSLLAGNAEPRHDKSFIPGQEANEVLRKCKEWAAHGGALQVQDGAGGTQTISIRITGVDLQPILENAENAENVDNYGNKVARVKMLVFEAPGVPDHQELFFRHEFRWRGTDRQAEVCFGNIREISDDRLEVRGEDWKIVIDYPFDRDGHNLNEDLDRLETFRATFPAQRTICWLPSFLNHEAQKAIGTLVRLEHILSEIDSRRSWRTCRSRFRRQPSRCSRINATSSAIRSRRFTG